MLPICLSQVDWRQKQMEINKANNKWLKTVIKIGLRLDQA